MTSQILSPYKEERQASQSFPFILTSPVKLSLVILLALLGCLNLSASSGILSRRKSRREAKRSAALNNIASHANAAAAAATAAAALANDDDDNNDNDAIHSSHDLLDEEMRRLLQERNRAGAKRGKVAWLMSFPNSGTSFTSLLVRVASNSTAATNYGMETRVGADGMSVPIYDWSVEGPYWMHPPEENDDNRRKGIRRRTKSELPPPSSSILTKTHCGGRCITCPPEKYLETLPSFLQMCLSGSRKVPSTQQRHHHTSDEKRTSSSTTLSSIQYKKQYVTYHPAVVERAIHIIRNPFDNLVSRFHHEQKEYKKKNRTSWTKRYSNDVAGFKKWCVDVDSATEFEYNHVGVDWRSYGYNQTALLNNIRGVSCHTEFFRYAQWHILALQVVELLDMPVLYVHYEDYAKDINVLTDQILRFLNLDRSNGEEGLPYFQSNKDYSAYFTREERASASEFMRKLVDDKRSEKAHELLERYWVDYDFKKMAAETGSIK